jgi:hypothetical protein
VSIAFLVFCLSQVPTASGAAPSPSAAPETLSEAATSPLGRTASEKCPDARAGLRFYRSRYNDHREGMGAETTWPPGRKPLSCADARYLAKTWRARAADAREDLGRFLKHQRDEWNWQGWLPRLWYAIGMCETALDWHFDSGTYVSAFGIIRSAFPGWNGSNSPREQYRVALGIAGRYGLGAWGCYSHGGYRYHLR